MMFFVGITLFMVALDRRPTSRVQTVEWSRFFNS